jgi:beta-galactosidase
MECAVPRLGDPTMNRRSFLKTTATLTAAATLSKRSLATPAPLAAGRAVYPINSNWRYSPTPPADFHSATFDDAATDLVTVPHTNIPMPWHSFDDKRYEFVSGYRRPLAVPAGATSGKRVFADFEGVMLSTTFYCNGTRLGEYKGGYTPFSFELTDYLKTSGNYISLDCDSTERQDIPPFGNEVDYLTFGGIYREVALRIVPQVFISNIHARTRDVLTKPAVDVDVYLDRSPSSSPRELFLHAELRDGDKVIAKSSTPLHTPAPTIHYPADADQAMGALPYNPAKDGAAATLTLTPEEKVALWDLDAPKLYTVHVELHEEHTPIDKDSRRLGFREAKFTPGGFSLNGKIIQLHGLDRHQTFPWVGQAMPARPQRQDARILRYDCRCNIVRTSHYPQSRHFLDACDEIGLLVLEEIPGWQHIGDIAWQDIAVDNVRRMVTRDWNHPSIILWGVRINESDDNHDFYTRTNAMAHALDMTRQTGGIRSTGHYNSEFLEDVFTYNDFDWPIHKPNHALFLNTEFVGHTFPTKTIDAYERQREHVIRHARMHDALASDPQYAGGIGWCAFDYNTHASFGSGDRICYHGVMDTFRTPKPAAGFYKSMAPRDEKIVLEPAFYWAVNDESQHFDHALICSNVDTIRMTTKNENGEHLIAEGGPDRVQFPHLKYPPFTFLVGPKISKKTWGDVTIEGLIDGKVAITKKMSGSGADDELLVLPDETSLVADGADSVRIVLRSVDACGSLRHYAADAISFELSGPATFIGENPFGLIGGTGAIWLRTTHEPGTIILTAKHPYLGTVKTTLTSTPAAAETV